MLRARELATPCHIRVLGFGVVCACICMCVESFYESLYGIGTSWNIRYVGSLFKFSIFLINQKLLEYTFFSPQDIFY